VSFVLSAQVDDFVRYVTNMSQAYTTNNVVVTMGEDFNYQSAHMWFKNLDKLIK
jgi:lysosomal alpha-mannosidase